MHVHPDRSRRCQQQRGRTTQPQSFPLSSRLLLPSSEHARRPWARSSPIWRQSSPPPAQEAEQRPPSVCGATGRSSRVRGAESPLSSVAPFRLADDPRARDPVPSCLLCLGWRCSWIHTPPSLNSLPWPLTMSIQGCPYPAQGSSRG